MNRPFIHGINFEERLRTKLEALGCRIYYDQTYDHQYKLDFIVNGEMWHAYLSILVCRSPRTKMMS